MDSRYIAAMSLTASIVAGELMTTWPASSCSAAPNAQRRPRSIMLLSGSGASPNPAGTPRFSRIFRVPSRMCSQVSGLKPASAQRSVR